MTTPIFLATIGDALKRALIAHNTNSVPHQLVAHIESWEQPNPTFDVWSCPANPEAKWGRRQEGDSPITDETLSIKLLYVDSTSSDKCPVWPHHSKDGFPQTSISSNFKHMERYFVESKSSERAPGLYLPEPGLANAWPILRDSAEVDVVACYDISAGGTSGTGWVTFCTRFSDESLAGRYKNLNTHLLDLPPPDSWKTCKQFGDEYYRTAKKPRGKQSRKRGGEEEDDSILASLSFAL